MNEPRNPTDDRDDRRHAGTNADHAEPAEPADEAAETVQANIELEEQIEGGGAEFEYEKELEELGDGRPVHKDRLESETETPEDKADDIINSGILGGI